MSYRNLPMTNKDRYAKLVGLFFLALLLFNFPLLALFGKGGQWLGIPSVLWYLFSTWVVLILLINSALRHKNSNRKN